MNPGALNHRVRIRRPTQGTDDYADPVPSYADAGTYWMGIEPDRGRLRDVGPGERPAAPAKAIARYGVDVRPRDVLEVLSGPEKGTTWRVQTVFHPGKHHTELQLDQFTGTLP